MGKNIAVLALEKAIKDKEIALVDVQQDIIDLRSALVQLTTRPPAGVDRRAAEIPVPTITGKVLPGSEEMRDERKCTDD